MNSHRLYTVLIRYRARFLATFPALTAQDLRVILEGPSETLLDLLQARYGYTHVQAKAAWNDFVLDHIDGCGDNSRYPADEDADPARSSAQALDATLWRLMCLGWGHLAIDLHSAPHFSASKLHLFPGLLH